MSATHTGGGFRSQQATVDGSDGSIHPSASGPYRSTYVDCSTQTAGGSALGDHTGYTAAPPSHSDVRSMSYGSTAMPGGFPSSSASSSDGDYHDASEAVDRAEASRLEGQSASKQYPMRCRQP